MGETPNRKTPMDQMPQDPNSQPAPGKTVSITQNADGTFTVEAEPKAEMPEAPEMAAENGAQDMAEDKAEGEPAQTVKSLDEALAAVKQMLGAPADDRMSVEQAFKGGFQGDEVNPKY